jgi:hypothetical protein
MASAFISYAHEDELFVTTLAEHLQAQQLEIRYDQVALHIGESLTRAISREVTTGDYLVAVISPNWLESPWCQRELELAHTQGINEKRVKVLPIRFRGALLPDMFADTFCPDANVDDIETIARRLAASIRAYEEGRGEEADRDAAQVEGVAAPAHRPGVTVVAILTQLGALAQRVFDVLARWSELNRGGNFADVEDAQRRLIWELTGLPEYVRVGLPLTVELARAPVGFFIPQVFDLVHDHLQDEMNTARTQLAQGLPVPRRWFVDEALGEVDPGGRDAVAYLWQIRRGEETKRIVVYISGTAMASDNAGLPEEVRRAKASNGGSVAATLAAMDDPATEVLMTTAGLRLTLPE